LWLVARGYAEVRANAVDWAGPARVAGWHWVANTPNNYPAPGDVVVWRANVAQLGIGSYGHVAVVVSADQFALVVLQQDWPVGAPVALGAQSYVGVAGWQSPGLRKP
jgi:hypothetical protein